MALTSRIVNFLSLWHSTYFDRDFRGENSPISLKEAIKIVLNLVSKIEPHDCDSANIVKLLLIRVSALNI